MAITKNFMVLGRGALLAGAVSLALFAPGASAAPISGGDTLKLTVGVGNTGGGNFHATVLSGAASGQTFETFCLERNEYFNPGAALTVAAVSYAAVNGGLGGGNPDLISNETAWLYTQFWNNALSGYTGNTASANSLQRAIWFLENEITPTDVVGGLSYNSDATAQGWVADAIAAGWTNVHQVRVLNLKNANGSFSQDQLYITPIPEPEAYAMLLAGLGLMGFVARRRKLNGAA